MNLPYNITLEIGSSFIFKGNFCTITKIFPNAFCYDIHDSKVTGYMTHKYYKDMTYECHRNITYEHYKKIICRK